jgi:predicted Fe-Mo cluster-binding NifX family protein
MITAIAIQENNTDSTIDKHFGKCGFFFLFDDASELTEIIENPGKILESCRADAILKILKKKKVERVIAGDFGTKVQKLLNQSGIQMIINPDSSVTVNDILGLLILKKS